MILGEWYMEIWKDIKGYEGCYQVSNMGRIKSLSRKVWNGKNYFWTSERILRPGIDRDGYFLVNLSKNGKAKTEKVHRLVAKTFIPNPKNKEAVNHIDEDPSNNKLENLEWATVSENNNHGWHNKRSSKSRSKPIIQLNLDGEFLQEYQSATIAAQKLEMCRISISNCLNGRTSTAGGYKWRYKI